MNKSALIGTIAAVLIVLGGGLTFASVQNNNKVQHAAIMKKEAASAKMKRDEALKKDEEAAMMAKDKAATSTSGEAAMIKGTDAMVKGSFSDYSIAKLANAEKGKVVLFFSASWCPTCQEANKNFNASSTPEGLTLLKVDYDNSNDLKKKYGVTYQHTYVQVDATGKLLKKWSSSTTYDQLENQLKTI